MLNKAKTATAITIPREAIIAKKLVGVNNLVFDSIRYQKGLYINIRRQEGLSCTWRALPGADPSALVAACLRRAGKIYQLASKKVTEPKTVLRVVSPAPLTSELKPAKKYQHCRNRLEKATGVKKFVVTLFKQG